MVRILPFRGLRYNLSQGGSLTHVTAPPYDVIEPPLQERLYERHPANAVRLILGKKTPEDTAENTVYTRAAGYFHDWQQNGTLQADEKPCIYAYSQTWQGITRKGLIALLALEDYESRQVLPHERIIAKYVADRRELSRTVQANLSQIFMIYGDPQRNVEHRVFETPAHDWQEAVDDDGVVHRLRALDDPALIQDIRELFSRQTLLIADGHHRYQTALTLKQEARELYRERHGHEAPEGSLLTDYMMVFLANMDDPGLVVYPTHRLFRHWPDGWDQQRFETTLDEHFDTVDEAAFNTSPDTFLYEGPGRSPRKILRLKTPAALSGLHESLRTLDVAVLDEVVIKGFFEETAQNLKETKLLWFDRSEEAVRQLIERGETVAAFYMHAPSVHQVKAICEAGELMPQKSTYFYPKILSGTVFYSYSEFDAQPGHALSGVVENAMPLPAGFFNASHPLVSSSPTGDLDR